MKLSVITVCLNSTRFISDAIESVLAQDDVDLEYLIVDGGSTDGTVEQIQQFAEQDARIVWCSEPDEGISAAMNKGVTMASGEVIAHLNSDDYYAHPAVLSKVMAAFREEPGLAWLTGGLTFVAEDGRRIKEVPPYRYSARRLLRGNIILHPATFIRREVFLQVGGFDTTLHYCMDYDLFLRLAENFSPLTIREQLTCFRAHPESRSVVDSEQAYAEEYRVRMNYLEKRGRATWFYRLDHQFKRWLNKLFYRRLLEK